MADDGRLFSLTKLFLHYPVGPIGSTAFTAVPKPGRERMSHRRPMRKTRCSMLASAHVARARLMPGTSSTLNTRPDEWDSFLCLAKRRAPCSHSQLWNRYGSVSRARSSAMPTYRQAIKYSYQVAASTRGSRGLESQLFRRAKPIFFR